MQFKFKSLVCCKDSNWSYLKNKAKEFVTIRQQIRKQTLNKGYSNGRLQWGKKCHVYLNITNKFHTSHWNNFYCCKSYTKIFILLKTRVEAAKLIIYSSTVVFYLSSKRKRYDMAMFFLLVKKNLLEPFSQTGLRSCLSTNFWTATQTI